MRGAPAGMAGSAQERHRSAHLASRHGFALLLVVVCFIVCTVQKPGFISPKCMQRSSAGQGPVRCARQAGAEPAAAEATTVEVGDEVTGIYRRQRKPIGWFFDIGLGDGLLGVLTISELGRGYPLEDPFQEGDSVGLTVIGFDKWGNAFLTKRASDQKRTPERIRVKKNHRKDVDNFFRKFQHTWVTAEIGHMYHGGIVIYFFDFDDIYSIRGWLPREFMAKEAAKTFEIGKEIRVQLLRFNAKERSDPTFTMIDALDLVDFSDDDDDDEA